MLDIARWRRRRREELAALADEVARRVAETGDREELVPMTPFERKIVHDAVAAVPGVHSESEGVEPERRVVVPATSSRASGSDRRRSKRCVAERLGQRLESGECFT